MASSRETITLISSEGNECNIKIRATMQSKLLKCMVNDECSFDKILVPNVTSQTLVKVVEYCEKHFDHEATKTGEEASNSEAENVINTWDVEFIKVDTLDTLFRILLAADYLQVVGMFDLACRNVANMVKEKEVIELRQMFDLKTDLAPKKKRHFMKI